MEPKFKDGSTVYAKVHPGLALVIRRYIDHIYFCRVQEDPNRKELAYFERELTDVPGVDGQSRGAL